MINNVIIYRDVDQTLNNNYLDNVEDVMQSIINILTTSPGELIFDAAFGSRLKSMLFELSTSTYELEVLSEINRAITTYEPRVDLNFGKLQAEIDDETHTLWITFVFTIKNISSEEFSQEVGFKKYESN